MFRNNAWNLFFIILAVVLVITEASFSFAETREFRGNFSANDEYGNMSVDIPFSVGDNTAVYLSFLSECTTQDKAYMEFYTPWGGRITWASTTDGLKERPGVIASEIAQPYGPFPLTAGTYGVRLYCKGEEWEPNGSVVGYRLTVSSATGIVSQFSRDPEPNDTEAHPIPVIGNTSIEGWLGLGGYEIYKIYNCAGGIDADSFCGVDFKDVFDVRIAPDTKFKIKLEYDSVFSKINRPEWYLGYDDMRVYIEYVKDGQTHFVATFEPWTNSGDLSFEINSYEGGIFRLSVFGLYYRDEREMRTTWMPLTNYGGYRLTVVVNEVPEPEELLVTVREATWQTKQVRDYSVGYRTEHYLDVNFDVENKYNETQTIVNLAEVQTPVPEATYIQDETRVEFRDRLIANSKAGGCQLGRIDWDEFCYKESFVDGYCYYGYYYSSAWSAPSSISAHSTKNYTLSISVTESQYYNFEQSFQLITVYTQRTARHDPEACYIHGLSFIPLRAFIPAVNLMLKD